MGCLRWPGRGEIEVKVPSCELSLDRHSGPGRRSYGSHDPLAVRGLLHDLAHEVATLSYLVEAVRGDPALPASSASRVELMSDEVTRLLDLIANEMLDDPPPAAPEDVDVRALANQMAQLATAAQMAEVVVNPGTQVRADVNPAVLWRVLSNVVGNATRAAGPDGRVEVTIRDTGDAVIDVFDNGPGFGHSPPGFASLGLRVVTLLLNSCGGTLAVYSPDTGGTRVRIVLPGRRAFGAARVSVGMSGEDIDRASTR
jgi:signal transduction histidine kinase